MGVPSALHIIDDYFDRKPECKIPALPRQIEPNNRRVSCHVTNCELPPNQRCPASIPLFIPVQNLPIISDDPVECDAAQLSHCLLDPGMPAWVGAAQDVKGAADMVLPLR
jgi:hypothetical protein